MKNKIKGAAGYLLYIMISNVIYGYFLYITVTRLAEYSELFAYLGNLVFIIAGLLMDEFTVRKLYSPHSLAKEIKKLKTDQDRELNVRLLRWILTYFVSFKTVLFFFYIFVLLFSQIINYVPGLVNEQMSNFIHLTDYSVIILLAFKDFSEEFSRDRYRMKKTRETFEEYVAEEADQ